MLFISGGLFFRSLLACNYSLWWDEGAMFFTSWKRNIWQIIFSSSWDIPSHPPVTHILLHFWQKISINLYWLRLPSLVFSGLFLFLVPLDVRKIFPREKKMPFLVLVSFVFSHPLVSLGFQLRPYALELFLMMLSLFLFFYMWNKKTESKKWPLFNGLLLFLMFLTDYSSVWLLLVYFVFYCYLFFKNQKKIFRNFLSMSLFLLGLLSLCWLPFFFRWLPLAFQGEEYLKDYNGGQVGLPIFFLEGHRLVGINDKASPFIPAIFRSNAYFLLLVGLSLLGNWFFRKKYKLKADFFLILLILPTLTSFFFSKYFTIIFLWRNLIIVHLAFIVNFCFLIYLLSQKFSSLYALMILVTILNFILSYPSLYIGPSLNWKNAAQLVDENVDNRAFIVTAQKWILTPLAYYGLLIDRCRWFNFWEDRIIWVDDFSEKSILRVQQEKPPAVFFFLDSREYENTELKNRFNCKDKKILTIDSFYLIECWQ